MKSMVKFSLGFLLVIILSLFVSAAPALAADFALETRLFNGLLFGITDISYEWAVTDNVAYSIAYRSEDIYYDTLTRFVFGTNIYFSEDLKGLYLGTTSSLYFLDYIDDYGYESFGMANGVGLNLGCRVILGRRSGLSLNGAVGFDMLFNWYSGDIMFLPDFYLKVGIAL